MQMSKDQSMQMYKKLALLLHPDKNQHPLAKEAFQKISEANKAVSNSAC
jgi:curved DNA-binding protein CbpA